MKKPQIIKIVLIGAAVILLVLAIIGCSMLIEYNSKGKGTGEFVTVDIKQGEGAWDIATKLKEQDLITSRSIFLLKVRSMGVSGNLRYGTFELEKGAGLEQLIQGLTSGGSQKEELMLTIPEGYTIELIAIKLESEGICSKEEFLTAVQKEYDYWFLESIPQNVDVFYRLEGFLYPDTYAISEDMTAEDIVILLLNQFDKKFTEEMKAQAERLGKTVYEVVTEASMIERECALDSERKTVAGVIQNRLEIGMRLQIDPTFLYPITNGLYDIEKATDSHKEYVSPYNTYRNKGLPVGPIANPGMLSLEAALNPEEHQFLYYHTDTVKNDGSHIFTKNYQDHLNTQN